MHKNLCRALYCCSHADFCTKGNYEDATTRKTQFKMLATEQHAKAHEATTCCWLCRIYTGKLAFPN